MNPREQKKKTSFHNFAAHDYYWNDSAHQTDETPNKPKPNKPCQQSSSKNRRKERSIKIGTTQPHNLHLSGHTISKTNSRKRNPRFVHIPRTAIQSTPRAQLKKKKRKAGSQEPLTCAAAPRRRPTSSSLAPNPSIPEKNDPPPPPPPRP